MNELMILIICGVGFAVAYPLVAFIFAVWLKASGEIKSVWRYMRDI